MTRTRGGSTREWLGHAEQRIGSTLVRDGDEDRPLRRLPTRSAGGLLQIQRRIVPKDGLLQLSQLGARFDPEPVDERAACILVGVQRLRLPPRPVERRHEVPAQALAQRVLGDECFKLPDELVVPPEREVGVDPELDRRQPDLLEPGDRRLRETLVGEVGERRASPQGQRLAQLLRPVCRQPASEQAPPLLHEALEAVEIERVRFDPDEVAGRPRRQDVRRQRLPQPRDVDPQRSRSVVRRALRPELVHQLVSGDDLVGVKEEHGEQRARLGPAEGSLAAFVPRLERSQDPELQPCLPDEDANCCSSETCLKRARPNIDADDAVRKEAPMKARHAVLALVAMAAGVTVTSVGAAAPEASKQRVTITARGLFNPTSFGKFVLTPLRAGALESDSGTGPRPGRRAR